MVVSANTFFNGSLALPSPPETGASISISALVTDACVAARHNADVIRLGRRG
jgi:hypothetical protein